MKDKILVVLIVILAFVFRDEIMSVVDTLLPRSNAAALKAHEMPGVNVNVVQDVNIVQPTAVYQPAPTETPVPMATFVGGALDGVEYPAEWQERPPTPEVVGNWPNGIQPPPPEVMWP